MYKRQGGTDVTKVDISTIENKKEFFNELKKNGEFVEELVIQDEEWAKLSPNSINTLRIMTSEVNGKSKILFNNPVCVPL